MNSSQNATSGTSRLNLRMRSWIAGVVLFAVVFVCVVLLKNLLPGESWALIRKIGPFYLVLMLLLSALGTALYTVAVFVLVRASGYGTTLLRVYLILTSSLSVNYVTPVKFGIPLRIYLYKHLLQIPLAAGTTLVALETWIGMLIPAMIATLGIALLFTDITLAAPVALLVVLVVAMAAMLLLKPSFTNPLLRRLPFQKHTFRLLRFAEMVQAGFRTMPLWRSLVVALLFGLNFAVATTRLYLVLYVLGWSVSWPALLAALTISITAGNLSMIPMGLGVRDASLTLLIKQLGVPNEIAISTAIIQRFFAPGWPLLLGVISANVLGLSSLLKSAANASVTQDEEAIDLSLPDQLDGKQ